MSQEDRFSINCQMAAGNAPPFMTIKNGIGTEGLAKGQTSSDDVERFLERNRNSPSVEVRINSTGGDAEQGIKIFNALRQFPGEVVTVNEGMALSAAALIFTSGARRLMTSGSQLMVHEASLKGVSGNADFIRKALDWLLSLNQSVAEMMGSRIGRTTAYLLDLMKRESWFDSSSAIREGFATGMSGSEASMSAGLDLSAYKNVPPAFAQWTNSASSKADDRFSVVL